MFLEQSFPKTGPQTMFGPPKSFIWSVLKLFGPKTILSMTQSIILLVQCGLKWSAAQFCGLYDEIMFFVVSNLKKFGNHCAGTSKPNVRIWWRHAAIRKWTSPNQIKTENKENLSRSWLSKIKVFFTIRFILALEIPIDKFKSRYFSLYWICSITYNN